MKTLTLVPVIAIVLICSVRPCISYYSVYDFEFLSIRHLNCCDRNVPVDAYSNDECDDGSPIRLPSCTRTKMFDSLSFDLIDRENETYLKTENEAEGLTVKYPK